ncbi:MAG: hypothetical protein GX785_18595 [Armatimonadetes bacterium]|nr:hypothetical protein [Armatimonadota bacterium]
MRAVSLKVVGGVAAVIVVGLGISLVIRDQNDARGGLVSPRSRPARSEQALVLQPDRVPGHVARLPVEKAPPLTEVRADPLAAEPLTAGPPAPSDQSTASPLTASSPGTPKSSSSVAARPPAPGGLRLPTTAGIPPPSITGAAPRRIPAEAPRTPPVTSPGSLGFHEEPAGERNPLLVMINCEDDTMVVILSGQKRYRRVLMPKATIHLQIEPGEYQVRVHATKSSPNSGRGVFREYHRYTARWVSVPTHQARPLRLGELSPESREAASEETPVIPVPEEP